MRKKLLMCDGCGKEHPGELLERLLQLSYRHTSNIGNDGCYNYDFCSYECLGRYLSFSAWWKHVERGIQDKGVSNK